MDIVAASKNVSDMDPEDYGSRKWLRPMQPETVVLGLVLIGLLFILALFGIGPGSFSGVLFPRQTDTSRDNIEQYDKLLGGLLSPNFDNESCISRYRSSMYRKLSPFPASAYLIQKLRNYEEHHKKCGPNTENYRNAVEQLKSGKNLENQDCQYLVVLHINGGMGNRMLSLVSTFLFSLLTNRVMLFEMTDATRDLFCEPFPESSWALPSDFPNRTSFWKFTKDSPPSYTFMVENKTLSNDVNTSAESLPSHVFLHLENIHFHLLNHIFCDNDHKIFQKINWIILRSECYFTVGFFLMPMYKEELEKMFPVKESVFHNLGRYLFQPANQVWELIDRYYGTYLLNFDERIGIQIRVFNHEKMNFTETFDRILECSKNTNLLPELGPTNSSKSFYAKKRTALLVASLFPEYYEKFKSMYYENSTVTGEKVAVYQPSHEEAEKNRAISHNQKALAEMFLLSYCDEIATTSWSTFGYIASGLGALRPKILMGHRACVTSESVEPCLHSPPILQCDGKKDINPVETLPFLRHCEDVSGGIKMFG